MAIAALRRTPIDETSSDRSAEPRLRHVTILFADVVGSTATGQRLDPEELNELMDAAMRRFTTLIEA